MMPTDSLNIAAAMNMLPRLRVLANRVIGVNVVLGFEIPKAEDCQ